MSKRKTPEQSDRRARDAKRAPNGAKSKSATLARKRARAAKREQYR